MRFLNYSIILPGACKYLQASLVFDTLPDPGQVTTSRKTMILYI